MTIPKRKCVFILASLGIALSVRSATAGYWSGTPVSAATLDSLLMQISQAQKQVSYSGVRMRRVWEDGQEVILRWSEYHWPPDRTLIIFLDPEEMRDFLIVSEGDEVRHQVNQSGKRRFRHVRTGRLLRSGDIFREIELLQQNYQIHALTGQSFMRRPTVILDVSHSSPDRPAVRAIVDAENGLLLQLSKRSVGAAADSFQVVNRFSDLILSVPDTAKFVQAWSQATPMHKRRRAQNYSDLAELAVAHNGAILAPRRIPDGFSLLKIRAIERDSKSYLHFLYGDGLTFISLFQHHAEREPGEQNGRGGTHRHQNSPFAVQRGTLGEVAYSIASEIPARELAVMAESLSPLSQPTRTGYSRLWIYAIAGIILIIISYSLQRRKKQHV